MIHWLDIIGTFAFSVTGAFKARTLGLNIFAVVFLGVITAVGGGTFRDVIIGRTPLFYLIDSVYLMVAIAGALATYIIPNVMKKHYSFLRFLDSLGLAVFVIIGTSIAYEYLFSGMGRLTPEVWLSSIFVGMITGFGGGILREAVMGEMSFAFKKESNYILAAFLGATSFYILASAHQTLAIAVSMTLTMWLREIDSPFGLYKRVWQKSKRY